MTEMFCESGRFLICADSCNYGISGSVSKWNFEGPDKLESVCAWLLGVKSIQHTLYSIRGRGWNEDAHWTTPSFDSG